MRGVCLAGQAHRLIPCLDSLEVASDAVHEAQLRMQRMEFNVKYVKPMRSLGRTVRSLGWM